MSNKRLLKEINTLYAQQYKKPDILDNDYLVHLNELNTNIVHTIIKAPSDSAYRHKFIRLDMEIPNDYPHSPPSVKFINKDSVRIHPNMYEDGKCCATILNTWPSDNEKWTSSMGIETILIMFHSFLDNNPYTYEPGGRDDPTYTEYVIHQSWKTCLFDYLDDYNQPDIFTEFIRKYMIKNINSIYRDLYHLSSIYPLEYYETRCFEIDLFIIDYSEVLRLVQYHYRTIILDSDVSIDYINDSESKIENYNTLRNFNDECNICFDTLNIDEEKIRLNCSHKFHKLCIKDHIKTNGNICSVCRQIIDNGQIIDNEQIDHGNEQIYVINPETNRKIKVGGKTYNMLIDLGYDL